MKEVPEKLLPVNIFKKFIIRKISNIQKIQKENTMSTQTFPLSLAVANI